MWANKLFNNEKCRRNKKTNQFGNLVWSYVKCRRVVYQLGNACMFMFIITS